MTSLCTSGLALASAFAPGATVDRSRRSRSTTSVSRSAERDRRQIAGIERRQRIERRGEGERLPFLDVHVAHVGRVDRLEPLLAQRIVHRARDEVVRHVVEDLVLEALLDDARRRLARAEARHARLARIVARDPVDLGRDHVARDFDAHVLARRVDVDELSLHWSQTRKITRRLNRILRVVP